MAEATATNPEQDTGQDALEKIPGDVKIEETGPAARRLTITVSAETVSEKIEDAMGTLATETALPGFRKGRAPKALIEKRFGTALRKETKNQIVAGAYASAIEEHKLEPVGDPESVGDLEEVELEAGKPLSFSVDIEVLPEFDLPAFDGIEVKKPVLDISEELIEQELVRYQKHLGDRSKIEAGFRAGDRLLGKAKVTKKGEDEPFFNHDQVAIIHPGDEDGGNGQVLGLIIEGLAGMLDGRKVTETLVIETTAPEGHEREDIRGADLVIEFEINQAERVEPVTVAKVVELMGLGTEQILREQIKMTLEQKRDDEQAAAMRQQVADHLLTAVDFELPAKLSERQVTRNLERHRLELLYQGMDPDDVEERLAEVRADSTTATQNRLKLFFLLKRLADSLGVEVSEAEANGRVASMAMRRGMRPEQLMNELSQAGRMGDVVAQIRENKALDRVVQQAKVTEISAEDWRKLHEDKAEADARATGGSKKTTTKKTTKKKTTSKKTAKKAAAK